MSEHTARISWSRDGAACSDGETWMERVVLRPRVAFSGDGQPSAR